MSDTPPEFVPTHRTKLHRGAQRGVYDRLAVHRILDEALVCHVAFVDKGSPMVLPTTHVRIQDRLYIHGSRNNRMLQCACRDSGACLMVSILDGLVLARSAMHHSVNYRSVAILARGAEITDPGEKATVLEALVEHVIPGRVSEVRAPNDKELAATKVIFFPIEEASAKVRTGPPVDDEADYDLPVWAGVIPVSLTSCAPIPDPRLGGGLDVPSYATNYSRSAHAS